MPLGGGAICSAAGSPGSQGICLAPLHDLLSPRPGAGSQGGKEGEEGLQAQEAQVSDSQPVAGVEQQVSITAAATGPEVGLAIAQEGTVPLAASAGTWRAGRALAEAAQPQQIPTEAKGRGEETRPQQVSSGARSLAAAGVISAPTAMPGFAMDGAAADRRADLRPAMLPGDFSFATMRNASGIVRQPSQGQGWEGDHSTRFPRQP